MDWLALQHPRKLKLLELGMSHQGRKIRAFQMGDPTLPTVYIMCAQHGDETMARESAYLWVRDLLTRFAPRLWQELCIVVTPTVNVDRITKSRLTSIGTNLNSAWQSRTAGEVKAAASILKSHNVILVIDAHEGGKFRAMEGAGPTALGTARAIKDQASRLHVALATAFRKASLPFQTYPGGTGIENARNSIAISEGVTTYLFEAPSLLGDRNWSPDPSWRNILYTLAYDTVLRHVRDDLINYIAAKAAANDKGRGLHGNI